MKDNSYIALLKSTCIYICFFLNVIVFFSCQENSVEVIKSFTSTSDLPKQSAEKVQIMYTDSGKLQVKMNAPKLERYEQDKKKEYILFPEGIEVYFYSDSGTIKSQITANHAKYYTGKKLWEARNNVRAQNQEGDVLETELLFWDDEKDLIYTDQFAKVRDDQSIIQGEGFEAKEDLSQWEFNKVTGHINLKNEKKP